MVREAPFGHDAAAAADDAGDAPGSHRDIGQAHAGVDGEIIDPLLGLLDQRVAEDLPAEVLGDPADLLQRLIDRDGADRDRAVADDPFAGVVDVAAGGEVHHRVGTPADRPDHLVDLGGDVAGDRAIADVGVDLDEEVAPDRHRLGLGVVDVGGDDRAAARDLLADEFGRDVFGDGGAPGLALGLLREALAAEILALRDIFHLGGDDPAAGIMHLAEVGAGLRAQHPPGDIGKGGDAARAVGPQLAIVLRPDFARRVILDIAALELPRAAQLRQAGADVDLRRRVGVGAAGVVDPHRRLAALEVDLAHGDRAGADVDLAAAADRAGGDADVECAVYVGHAHALLTGGARTDGMVPPAPSADANRFRFDGSDAAMRPSQPGGSPGMAAV